MGLLSSIGGALFGDPSDDIQKATEQQLAQQQKGLDYIMDVNQPILDARNQAIPIYSDFYLNPESQAAFYEQTMASPQYQYMQQAGNEAVLNNAAATGGLRSGTANQALAQSNQAMLNNLVNQQMQGIGNIAGQQINTAPVASMYNNMGQTQAGGTMAQAQAQQALAGQTLGTILGVAGMGFGGGGGAGGIASAGYDGTAGGALDGWTWG